MFSNRIYNFNLTMDLETSDYDEDIILPNSPLSQYLHDEMLEESDINEYRNLITKDNSEQSETTCNTYIKLSYIWHVVLNIAKLYLNHVYSFFVPSLISFEHSQLKTILKSPRFKKVLLPEDISVLLNYEGDEDFSGDLKLSYATVFQQCFQLLGFITIYLILKSSTAINIITESDLFQHFFNNFYFVCLSLKLFSWFVSKVFFINIFIIIAFVCINITELFLCKALCSSIEKNLRVTESIKIVVKKCTRLIQEAELIARGFTYASVPGIVERLELSTGLPITLPQRQYPELRKHVFVWNKEMFMLHRKNTQKLIKDKIIGPAIDISSQSMAVLDIKEFGGFLSCNIDSDAGMKELLKLTDNLSVSSLKTVYLLAELQISEFFKYLYLVISFVVADEDLFHFLRRIRHFYALNSAVMCLHNKQSDILNLANKIYKFYRSIETHSDVEDRAAISAKSESSAFEINLHNMGLHLRAALKRLTDLEELFEEAKNLDKSGQKKILKKVNAISVQIKSEIDAYCECYEKCSSELQDDSYSTKEHPVDPSHAEQILKNFPVVKAAIAPRCDIEQDIEDEIFEAIVSKFSNDDNKFEVFPVEERKNDEVAGKLLCELKNVLIVKADEHRLREEKALAKKGLQTNACSSEGALEEVKNECEVQSKVLSEAEDKNVVTALIDTEIPTKSLECTYEDKSNTFDSNIQFNIEHSPKNSFASSIAALALQRQKKLGILNEACFSDGNSSDDEVHT